MEYSSYLVSRICATGMNKKLQIYLTESDNFPYLITEENVRRSQASKQESKQASKQRDQSFSII